MNEKTVFCELTGLAIPAGLARQGFTIRPSIFKLIQEVAPKFNNDSWISNEDLKGFKLKYVESIISEEEDDKEEIRKFVAQSVANHDFLSINYLDSVNNEEEKRTFKETVADKVAEFGGSWSFIFVFFIFVIIWCVFNTYVLASKSFDAYPYVFLNLVLGCIASIQAPIIMMSQNRTSELDRKRALNDFKVNLKSEFEIMILREKIDHVIHKQNPHIRQTLNDHSELLEDIKQTLNELKQTKNE